ncbi:MAG: hypothetical protein DDT33_01579 [Firmicutes bacterium]|nr:hypothetical protein [Bacillota bacterium]
MPNTKAKYQEVIDDREGDLLLSIIGAAKPLWENDPPAWMSQRGFTREDIQELSSKLLEFRIRVRKSVEK